MNDDIAALLHDVVQRLQRSISARDCPAIVAVEGRSKIVLSDYDYLRDDETAHAFERRAAEKAHDVDAVRWVLAVPQVWKLTAPGRIAMRAVSNHPLRDGESEAITWMSYGEGDGVDYGRVPYVRRPNGDPIFDAPEVFTTEVRPTSSMPGFALLQAFLGDEPEIV